MITIGTDTVSSTGGEIRAVEKREVEKMMSCKGPDRGYFVYQCPKCGVVIEKSLGCNSRLCSGW
ncbi:hypothetical protein CW714_06725 [Methanophagales archaeon]|nr:MAG: hypothetical protein CW714_06725 [Methanophagales archaeon]